MDVCEMCQAEVEDQDVLMLEGISICASCKPAAIARLQERGKVFDDPFDHLDFKEFKALRNANESLRGLGGLWLFSGLLCLIIGSLRISNGLSGYYFLGVSIVLIIASIGVLLRSGRGRILGLILCWLGVVVYPVLLVTAVAFHVIFVSGVLGWVLALVPAVLSYESIKAFGRKELFGPERLDPKEIRAVWKVRRKTKT